MRLNPKSIERLTNFTIKHYELGEDKSSPSFIKIYSFDMPPLHNQISYAEFFTKQMENKKIQDFSYFVDSASIWQTWRGGKIIQIGVIGDKGLQNCLRLVKFLREEYNISLENVTINFPNEDFIYKLLKGGDYYG